MNIFKNPSRTLFTIKIIHTVIWAFFVFIILYILYASMVDRIGPLVWGAVALVFLEGIILLINRWQCPLTIFAAKYTADTNDGFDIFLPTWLAKNNKLIFTSLYLAGLILAIYRVLT